jgi:hypothetical protein
LESWAETATGDPPAPRAVERRQVEQRRRLLSADERSAAIRAQATQRRRAEIAAEIAAEIRQTDDEIALLHLEDALAEIESIESEIAEAEDRAHECRGQLVGLHRALNALKIEAQRQGRPALASRYQDAAVLLESMKPSRPERSFKIAANYERSYMGLLR